MTHGETSCIHSGVEAVGWESEWKGDRKERRAGTSCTAAVCCLRQKHKATLFIQCHVLSVGYHSDRTVKAFTTVWHEGWWGNCLSGCVSPSHKHAPPYSVRGPDRPENTAAFHSHLCFRQSFGLNPCSVSTALLRLFCTTRTVMTLQQTDGYFQRDIEKQCWENYKGASKERSAWITAIVSACGHGWVSQGSWEKNLQRWLSNCKTVCHYTESRWHCYLPLRVTSLDFVEHPGSVYVIITVCACLWIVLSLSYKAVMAVNPAEEINFIPHYLFPVPQHYWVIC